MADEVMTAVRVACAGRATAHVQLPEHADHAALKAAAGAALGDPYALRLAAPAAIASCRDIASGDGVALRPQGSSTGPAARLRRRATLSAVKLALPTSRTTAVIRGAP